MKNETTRWPTLANIKRPMLWIAFATAAFWIVVITAVVKL